MISFVLSLLLAEMSMWDLEVPQHFKRGAHYAALLSKLDGTAAVPWIISLFISFYPSCQKPSQLIYHPLSLVKLDFTIGRQR